MPAVLEMVHNGLMALCIMHNGLMKLRRFIRLGSGPIGPV